MIDFSALQDNLFDQWLTGELTSTGFTFVWADQNAPTPNGSVVFGRIGSMRKIGDDQLATNVDGGIDIGGIREFTLRLEAIGSGSLDLLSSLETSLERPTILDSLRSVQIVAIRTLAMQDLTGLFEGEYESRGVLEIEMRIPSPYEESLEDEPGYFDHVTGEGAVENGQEIDIPISVTQ